MDGTEKGGGVTMDDISDDEVIGIELKSSSSESSVSSMDTSDTTAETTNVTKPVPLPPSPPGTSANSSATPRLKAYPPGSKGPFLVFFRPKGKPLNKLQIEKDLAKSFRCIEEVSSLSRDKLRVTVSDREQANRIVAHELFSMEYRVYIPSREVEISGVVTEPYLSCEAIKRGSGRFKNRAIPPVPILDVRQMNKVSSNGTKTSSNSYHLTFSGSALPDYLVLGKLWLPVRLYVPTVMHCDKCQQMGHTAPFCCNKARCGKCGEQHVEGPCTTDPKCTCCGEAPHDLTACPKFIEREKHQIRSLQQRSKRTYAEMLKKLAPPAPPPGPNKNNNLFASLPDNDHGSDSEASEGYTVVQTGSKRKRAARQKRQHVPKVQQEIPLPLKKSGSGGKTTKVIPPGFKPASGDFPPLPGSSKTPDVSVFTFKGQQTGSQEQQQKKVEVPEKMELSKIVDIIFDLLNVSPATRNLIKMALSFLTPLLKQLASKWPALESFISFDG